MRAMSDVQNCKLANVKFTQLILIEMTVPHIPCIHELRFYISHPISEEIRMYCAFLSPVNEFEATIVIQIWLLDYGSLMIWTVDNVHKSASADVD